MGRMEIVGGMGNLKKRRGTQGVPLLLRVIQCAYFIMTLRALPSRMMMYKPLPLMALSLVPPTV